MNRTIDIQKVDGYGKDEKNCMVSVELKLDSGNFSASADLWNSNRSDILMGGRCFDNLLNNYPELKDNDVFMETYDLWSKYHLNGMHAGTPEQEKAIEEWMKERKAQGNEYDYKSACEYLKSIGLYEVPVATIDLEANPQFKDAEEGAMYEYGHSWLKEKIPEQDVERIESLIKKGVVKDTSMYTKMMDDLEPEL